MPANRVIPPHPTDANSRHDDRYYTETESDAALALKATASDVTTALAGKAAQADMVTAQGDIGDLTPTNNGEFVSKVGGTITSVKPGRIDARVRGLSTASSDNTTLLATLATESGNEGSELWIPEGDYKGVMVLASHTRANGKGTLKPPTSPVAGAIVRTPAGATDGITIAGITINGNGQMAGIDLNSYPNTTTNAQVHGVTITNTDTTFDDDYGVRVSYGDGVAITSSGIDCHAPVRIYNSRNVRVESNDIADAVLDAIEYVIDESAYVGRGVIIAHNRITGCNSMGIEIYASGGTNRYLDAPLIAFNDIRIADSPSNLAEAFGISNPGSRHARVIGNAVRWYGAGTKPSYGLEMMNTLTTGEAIGHEVLGNYVYGFDFGIAVNSASGSVIRDNRIEMTDVGIEEAASYANSRYLTIAGNRIVNARETGIVLANSGDNGGHDITDNVILRDQTFTGDNAVEFAGMRIFRQRIPSRINRNRIVQGHTAPTLWFYRGIHATATLGQLEATEISYNQFVDLKTGGAMMTALICNNGGTAVADVDLLENKLVDDDWTHTAVSSW